MGISIGWMCCVVISFILDVSLVDVPAVAGVKQQDGRTGFLIRLPSAVLA